MVIDLPLTVDEAARQLRSGTLTSVELTSALLSRADLLDPKIGTYVTRFDEQALEQASRADKDFARGVDKGPYQGIPIGIKDILAVAEGPTTANSLVLSRAWGSGKDAPIVKRLKAAGAVITGKTTTSEFAIGGPDPSKPFAIPRNPWNINHSPGASSAGSGNGIAAGLLMAGIGTDTGGSIRVPAAYNGITGLMPTFGRVPKSGCVPLASSLDRVGPMARTARDCAAMLGIIAGYHGSDDASVARPVEDYTSRLNGDLSGLRIGVERSNHFPSTADPALVGCFDAALTRLGELGAEFTDVTLPRYVQVSTASWLMLRAEALAYHHNDLASRWADYYALTRTTLACGALASAADYFQAARVRRVAQQELAQLFDHVHVIATPTAPTAAPTIPQNISTLLDRSVLTRYWNAVGNPALAVPMGFSASGLPLSLHLASRPFDEVTLLQVGDAYQRVTDWHLRLAPMLLAAQAAAYPTPTDHKSQSAPSRRDSQAASAYTESGPSSERDVAAVRRAMRTAGLSPTEDEVAILASTYRDSRPAVESLYELPQTRYQDTALVFHALQHVADWSADI